MTTTSSPHPTEDRLRAYGLGKLDPRTSDTVHAHLEACDDCRNRVAELSGDSFLGRIRAADDRPRSRDGSSKARAGAEGSTIPGTSASVLPPGLADHPDYQVLRELGRGGMGVVYLAHNRLMGRDEVLKLVSKDLLDRKGVLDRFLREIRSAARLHHPNVVSAHSAFRCGESVVFAMEYVDGLDLARLVKSKGPVPVANAAYFIHQAALGLQHAHELGMVHRDIKPGNLMLARIGKKAVVKILDFGLAKATREDPIDGGLTHEGQMLGTPDYVAPEQTLDAQKADIRADIYSLGCTLYYLLAGGPPFRGTSLYDILQAHHSMDAKPLNLVRTDVPLELAALVAKMMAKDPGQRFQEPIEVSRALAKFYKSSTPARPATLETSTAPASVLSTDRTVVERPAATRPPATPSPDAAKSSRKDVAWDSLIEFGDSNPSNPGSPAPPHESPSTGDRRRLVLAASVVGILMPTLALVYYLASGRGETKVAPPAVTVAPTTTEVASRSKTTDPEGPDKRDERRPEGSPPTQGEGPDQVSDAFGSGATSPSKPAGSGRTEAGSPRKEDHFATLLKSFGDDSASGGGPGSPAPRPRVVSLFNGKDINGWTASGETGEIEPSRHWSVHDGTLHGWGGPTHLFSPRGDYEDVLIRAEVMINDGGNSGLFFRTRPSPGFPFGYEAQINSTHKDPAKTGSLYRKPLKTIAFAPSPIPPDTWFTLVIQAVGPGIRVWVDGTPYIDWVDSQNTYRKGYLAIQAHGPQTHIQIRKLEVVELAGTKESGTQAALAPQPKGVATTADSSTDRPGEPKTIKADGGDRATARGPQGLDVRRIEIRPGVPRLAEEGATLPILDFWPSLTPDDVESWRIGDPGSIKLVSKGLSLDAGPRGNLLLTRRADYRKSSLSVSLAATKGTEAYLVLRANLGLDGWHGITTRLSERGGKVQAGLLSLDFLEAERGKARSGLAPDQFFNVEFKVDERGISRVLINGQVTATENQSTTPAGAYVGAAGFFVKSGTLTIRQLQVRD